MSNTKDRVAHLQREARRLLEDHNIDITQNVELRPLAKELEQRLGCHYETAKRHIVRAIRLARGEESKRRGGLRNPPGGRPRKDQ